MKMISNKHRKRKQQPPRETETVGTLHQPATHEKRCCLTICFLLFVLGTYQSINFYGHQIVPNSDFPGFYSTGKAILSLKLPGTFKRAPVTGMLQCVLTPLMSGNYPDLKAGWLLNAILHPLNGILFFLLARQLIGPLGKWFALICLINPWVLYLLLEPIAETTLLFFILLTTLFIFKRSRWCYLLAAIATMVRYECAALILAAFVVDMIDGKSKKERFRALGFSVFASIPLGLWLLATVLKESGSTHYFEVFKASSGSGFDKLDKDRVGIMKHFGLIWSVGYQNLFSLRLGAEPGAEKVMIQISRIFAGGSFLLGVGLAVFRKNWKVMVLGIFLVPYFLIHAYYPYPILRFHMPSFWIALLISLYGLYEGGKIVSQKAIGNRLLSLFSVILSVIFMIWFLHILPNLELYSKMCPKAVSMFWVSIVVSILMVVAALFFNRFRGGLKEICFLSILLVVIVSNQASVSWLLNTGNRDAEFKELADWYAENAQEGEKLATTMDSVVRLYLPAHLKWKMVNYRNVKGEDILDFAHKLHEKNVVYIAWDSRLGLAPQDPYFDLYHLDKIKMLVYAKDQGPYKFVKQITNGRRFINIFKLENVDRYPQKLPQTSSNDKAK